MEFLVLRELCLHILHSFSAARGVQHLPQNQPFVLRTDALPPRLGLLTQRHFVGRTCNSKTLLYAQRRPITPVPEASQKDPIHILAQVKPGGRPSAAACGSGIFSQHQQPILPQNPHRLTVPKQFKIIQSSCFISCFYFLKSEHLSRSNRQLF